MLDRCRSRERLDVVQLPKISNICFVERLFKECLDAVLRELLLMGYTLGLCDSKAMSWAKNICVLKGTNKYINVY